MLNRLNTDRPFLIRYGITGVTIALIYMGLFAAFKQTTSLQSGTAASLSLVISIAVQYFMHAGFTFKRSWKDATQARRFLITAGLGIALSQIVLNHAGPALGWPDLFSAASIMVLIPILNYVLYSLWVFATRSVARSEQS